MTLRDYFVVGMAGAIVFGNRVLFGIVALYWFTIESFKRHGLVVVYATKIEEGTYVHPRSAEPRGGGDAARTPQRGIPDH